MIFISTLVGRILQSSEFLRTTVRGWFLAIWRSSFFSKVVIVFTFVWGCIRLVISLFGRLCSAISTLFDSMNFQGIRAGGVDILAFANSVLPLDEVIALLITWFTVYSVCATIRFIRAAWAAIPFKAT